MHECPNCAANLKFDIKAQKLFCDHCETLIDPGSVEKDHDAEESLYFESIVYLCPQCGGKILCDDNTAATFCCYCGASTILTSRISQCKRPKYIIPFQKTKEDCKKAYREMMKGAFFAPKEFKDVNALKRFRAIYMPYWLCSVKANQDIEFEGSNYTQKEDYLIVQDTKFASYLESSIEGFMYDASIAFPDQLSTSVEPYYLSDMKSFTTSYFSGFYADINDVTAQKYENISKDMAINYCYEEFANIYPDYNFSGERNGNSLREALMAQEVTEELVMFPVWFLAYRKKNKVAYGVMNGQTGKIAVELPIDLKRFIGTALLVSLPIILLLNLFFVIKPDFLLGIMIVLATILAFLVNERISQVLNKIFYEDFQEVVERKDEQQEKKKKDEKYYNKLLITCLFFGINFFLIFSFTINIFTKFRYFYLAVVAEIIILFFLFKKIRANYRLEDVSFFNEDAYKKEWKKNLLYFIKPIAIVLLAIVVLLIDPVRDVIYYGAVFISMGLMIWTMLDLIQIQNKMIMRPMPQFNTRGGDEDAYKML